MEPIRIVWPGGEHDFRLRLGELRRLQDACAAGPEELLGRVRTGRWRVDDLIEILRLGLIGGGFTPEGEAAPLVVRLIEQQGALLEFKLPAELVLMHALLQPEGDELGKDVAGEATRPDDGASPASTATGP